MFYSHFQSQQTLKKFETFEEIIATPDIYEEYSNDSFVIDQDHKEFEFSNPPILNEKKTNPNLDEEISFSCRQCYKSFEEPRFLILHISTGKSLSEALIFASTNPQYDDRLFIELQVQYMKIPSSSLGRTCCVQKLL